MDLNWTFTFFECFIYFIYFCLICNLGNFPIKHSITNIFSL